MEAQSKSKRFDSADIQHILQNQQVIHSDPEIMSGVPVFCGSRVPLQTFFDYLEGDEGLAEFIDDFPYLENQAIRVLEAIARITLHQGRNSDARAS
jgi:uncharacterized protein (DUF433 family)